MAYTERTTIRTGSPSLWSRIRSYVTPPLTLKSKELARLMGDHGTSATGIAVNESTALNYSAVWAAVSLISSDVASLPLILYKRKDGGKERFADHPLYRVLHDEPNPEMSSMVFRETLQAHLLTWGNAYAEIVRDNAGRVSQLWPLDPVSVTPFRESKRLQYRVARPGGGAPDTFEAADVLHVPGLGFDGIVGYSVIAKAMESIGLGLASERFGSTFFGNGATFGGVFEHPGKMSDVARKNFRESLDARHKGVERAHKFIVTEEGMKYQRLGIPPEDAQFLETRVFQIREMARWFQVPPHKIGDLERATFSNIEQQDIEYYKSGLRRWLVRWEQEINRKLVAKAERNQQFVEHLIDGLLRGDQQSRYAAYAVGRQWGWLSADDVRSFDNMNPLPNGAGKMYLVPANMWPADKVPDPTVKPEPVAPAPKVDPEADDRMAAMRAERDTARADAVAAQVAADLATTRCKDVEASATATEAELEAARTAERVANDAAVEWRERVNQMTAQLSILTEIRESMLAADTRTAAAVSEAVAQAVTPVAGLVETAATAQAESARTLAESQSTAVTLIGEALQAAEARTAAAVVAAVVPVAEQVGALVTATGAATESHAEDARAVVAAHEKAVTALSAAMEASGTRTTDAVTGAVQPALDAHQQALASLQAELAAAQALTAKMEADIAQQAAAHAAREAEAKAVTDAAIASERQTMRAAMVSRLTGTVAAHRGLVIEAMGRLIRVETDRARKAKTTPAKLRSWMDAFYLTHVDICAESLLPVVRVHLAWTQSADDPVAVARRLAEAHVAESRRQLRTILAGDPDELSKTLERVLLRWEADRAAVVADALLAEEVEYLRAY